MLVTSLFDLKALSPYKYVFFAFGLKNQKTFLLHVHILLVDITMRTTQGTVPQLHVVIKKLRSTK